MVGTRGNCADEQSGDSDAAATARTLRAMSEHLLLISIGNTRTRIALARDRQLEPSSVVPNTDFPGLVSAAMAAGEEAEVLIASVNDPVADRLARELEAKGRRVGRFAVVDSEDRLLIPVSSTLDDPTTVGQDRLLDALGAFSRAQQACIVIDAGTAVTVDFVDGEGTFHGGAIAPGIQMMAAALHGHTAALPLVKVTPETIPGETGGEPFGKNTAQAIALGAVSAVRGLVHHLIDRYAQFYEAYPRIIATGGDAPLLFENDELVEHIVPDLTLMGMLEAYRRLEL